MMPKFGLEKFERDFICPRVLTVQKIGANDSVGLFVSIFPIGRLLYSLKHLVPLAFAFCFMHTFVL